jgi:hypothetical protein
MDLQSRHPDMVLVANLSYNTREIQEVKVILVYIRLCWQHQNMSDIRYTLKHGGYKIYEPSLIGCQLV